jgi:anti-anti-sigma factor
VVPERKPGTPLDVDTQWADQVATVTVRGEIDMSNVDRLRDCLTEIAGRHPQRLMIDLAAVGFLDTSAIHALVEARHSLARQCPMILCSPQPIVRRVFELTGLDQLFEIREAS